MPEQEQDKEQPAIVDRRSSSGRKKDADSPEPAVEAEDIDALKAGLEEEKKKAETYLANWQRAAADFQNYKRRTDAEKAETYQNAVGSIVKRYLPILDDMERALAARPADLAWVEGIELIYRKLQTILEAEGVKRIEAESQMFDPNFHEAADFQ